MVLDTDREILRLRRVLRDLVALSTIPAAWIGRDPPEVAAGLADAVTGLLHLDFVAVRLCDPAGGESVEVERTTGARGGERPHPGVVLPIGADGEGGMITAASERADFPTELDQLVLSLAANHAASAAQSARLLHERRRAEEELRGARDALEATVAAQTAELRRGAAYLAEAQRLTHTGSFALDVPAGEPTYSSDEHCRLFGFDRAHGIPSLAEFVQRIHPDDRARSLAAFRRGLRDAQGFDLQFRVVVPGHPLRHIRTLLHPGLDASGELAEFVGTAMDVTEQLRAEEERRAQLWFFESMDRINGAMAAAADLEEMLGDVLDVVLEVFGCDRAWLIYPSDPDADAHRVRSERTRPEYLGAGGLGVEIPNDGDVARVFRLAMAACGPVRFDPESGHGLPPDVSERFGIRSQIVMAVHPKVDNPYMFGLHQCSHARVWTAQEEKLFEAIGRRLADALDTLLMLRGLREAHQMVQARRDELRSLADEQAALRRVATLVAQGVAPDEIFAAVAEEVGRLASFDTTTIVRDERDGTATVLARWPEQDRGESPVGMRVPHVGHEGESVVATVLRTGRPARLNIDAHATGLSALRVGDVGVRCAAGAPIIVDGRRWGVIAAGSMGRDSLPPATESRIAAFTELVGTAIANADGRAELAASRARVVAAGDESRRRLERNLHDGIQQRLVSLGLELRAAEAALPPGDEVRARLAHTAAGLVGALDELVEISRGIHPAILAAGGLAPALRAVARRSAVPVELELHADRRLPEPVEVAAYYVVSEALTNAAKHAHASVVHVAVEADGASIDLRIRDDGVGGADPTRGSGLIGLTDRVEALGGRIEVRSPAGRGTSLQASIPITDG